jgi:hypothetical protein
MFVTCRLKVLIFFPLSIPQGLSITRWWLERTSLDTSLSCAWFQHVSTRKLHGKNIGISHVSHSIGFPEFFWENSPEVAGKPQMFSLNRSIFGWLKPHVCWLNLMKFFVQSLLFSCWTADCSQFPNWSNKRPFLDISDIPISPRCFFRNRTCICSRESGFYPVGGIAWKFRLDMFRTSWGGRPGTTRCYNGWLVHGIHGDNVG